MSGRGGRKLNPAAQDYEVVNARLKQADVIAD
jgi:hypothetical protein